MPTQRLPQDFVASYGEELLLFVYQSFQHRYSHSEVDSDDTPAEGQPSFHYAITNWKYEDWFYGGEPFSGLILISWRGSSDNAWVPCWTMTLQGKLAPNLSSSTKIETYTCLDKALKKTPRGFPFRGPLVFSAYDSLLGELHYFNYGYGDIIACQGDEFIKDDDDKILFSATYYGQIINLYD